MARFSPLPDDAPDFEGVALGAVAGAIVSDVAPDLPVEAEAFDPFEIAPRVDLRRIEDLIPYARNARTHSEEQIAQLKGLIAEFGWTNPILADVQGILAGHGRLAAARGMREAGIPIYFPPGPEGGRQIPEGHVPVIDCSGWSEAKRRAYILADNKAALNAGWDVAMLRVEIEEIGAAGIDVALTAFSDLEIQTLATVGEDAPEEEPGEGGGEDDSISFGGTKIPVSVEEIAKITVLLGHYVGERKGPEGFIRWLCEAREAVSGGRFET